GHQAGAHRCVIEDDGAGPAYAVLAPDMGPGLPAIGANDVDQGPARLHPNGIILTVDIERDLDFFRRHCTVPSMIILGRNASSKQPLLRFEAIRAGPTPCSRRNGKSSNM